MIRFSPKLAKTIAELQKGYDTGNLKKWGGSSYVLNDCFHCYQGLYLNPDHSASTVCAETAAFYEKRGFIVTPLKVGYLISLKKKG